MNDRKKDKEIDQHSGVETTGHEWDGLKELNHPAPRWWLWVFCATIIWAVGYWVIYPAWPTLEGNTEGAAHWTQYNKLIQDQKQILDLRGKFIDKIKTSTVQEIQNDPELYAFAVAGGKSMFKENCAACHGTGAQGGRGFPNLNDDDWIWGGSLEAIYHTIRVGVRSVHSQTRISQMPIFGEMLKPAEVSQVADYVLSLSGKAKTTAEGQAIFKQNCVSCHGETGHGGREFGAPNLADAIWLYGHDKPSIMSQINKPRHGIMPSWEGRLADETLKQLAVYVYSLGGGEKVEPKE